jgi:hypothetical protein
MSADDIHAARVYAHVVRVLFLVDEDVLVR